MYDASNHEARVPASLMVPVPRKCKKSVTDFEQTAPVFWNRRTLPEGD
jgi:hypothetical protein